MGNLATICVVEDNTPIRKLFTTLLTKANFEVTGFSDGDSAFEWLSENKPTGILLDILLPDVSGDEFLKKLRQLDHCKDVPVIAVTGFANPNDRQKYLETGFDAYMTKPINTASFVDDVKKILKIN
jgi:DNA-binding response OmpR family regulator